jgi:hypothetical protein
MCAEEFENYENFDQKNAKNGKIADFDRKSQIWKISYL